MTPPPARRPALQRPQPHPFDRPIVLDDDEPNPRTSPDPVQPPSAPTVRDHETTRPEPAPQAAEEVRRLKGGRKSYRGKATTVTFLTAEDLQRVRLAYQARGLRQGYPSMNDWMRDMLLAAASQLEAQYNDSQPFTERDIPRRLR